MSRWRGGSNREAKGVWQISRVAKKAIYLGQVETTDAEAAIRAAIEKFDIEPEQQDRVAARRVVTAR